MKHHTSKSLYAYWNKVRAGGFAPQRFDIEPACIAPILPEALIIERASGDEFRFRLAGTRICETFGREFRGANFLDFFNPGDASIISRKLVTMAQQGAVGVFHITSQTAHGHKADVELILLPLLHAQGRVDRYLGALSVAATTEGPGAHPLITHVLQDYELIWPQMRTLPTSEHPTTTPDCNFPVPAPPIQVPPLASNIRHSRIVRSERRQFRVYDGGRCD
ncbi:MAG TPA: PAS domain-containing protein [Hyphomicrobiaceae bacterium]|nr:PAS domain-containing protein [Hyphomicrobiaceae bacterium]